ncbi:MAG: radical SAM protein [Candidatus Methanomethylicota archaeon]|uniref:Radical SAM protein n=1 Tax=Thermoproteota archaeon TaxID=2056631 RepID=A0A497F669_9CREN|nr:MAG: radical SAM protein [Candidatus Verstraetearchaeota archaeon]
MNPNCRMVELSYAPGACNVIMPDGTVKRACEATLKKKGNLYYRLIEAIQLSRPEDYLSIYQSGCNHRCLKCHSWRFTQYYSGTWMSTEDLAIEAAKYEELVTVWEPRERTTMWHATDLCRHCGSCVIHGKKSDYCPGKLSPDRIVFSIQGWGPARNIIAFTGGDIACRAEFYAQAAEKIKDQCKKMWVLLETNGYGLTKENLEVLASGGVDSFWLDIKAYDEKVYKKLCGTTNKWILKAPELIVDMGFVLEVLTLFIPGWVEDDQIVKIAELIASIDPEIPFTILAFFPEYKMKNISSPTLLEMVKTYFKAKNVGLKILNLETSQFSQKMKMT